VNSSSSSSNNSGARNRVRGGRSGSPSSVLDSPIRDSIAARREAALPREARPEAIVDTVHTPVLELEAFCEAVAAASGPRSRELGRETVMAMFGTAVHDASTRVARVYTDTPRPAGVDNYAFVAVCKARGLACRLSLAAREQFLHRAQASVSSLVPRDLRGRRRYFEDFKRAIVIGAGDADAVRTEIPVAAVDTSSPQGRRSPSGGGDAHAVSAATASALVAGTTPPPQGEPHQRVLGTPLAWEVQQRRVIVPVGASPRTPVGMDFAHRRGATATVAPSAVPSERRAGLRVAVLDPAGKTPRDGRDGPGPSEL
jgi:hypothetical protein